MSEERKNFPEWMVDRRYIEQDGVCANMACLNPLANGFHRHHKDGDHSNVAYENLELRCIDCHFATYAEQHKDYNPLEEHRKLQRTVIEKIGTAIEGAMIGKLAGSSLERVLAGFDRQLRESWKEKGLNVMVEYPSPTFAMLRHLQKSAIVTDAILEGFKMGIMKGGAVTVVDIEELKKKMKEEVVPK